jgi:hypothetical protein
VCRIRAKSLRLAPYGAPLTGPLAQVKLEVKTAPKKTVALKPASPNKLTDVKPGGKVKAKTAKKGASR